MKRLIFIAIFMVIPAISYAQDAKEKAQAPISFELDEEKLNIEADIPSVDLIISFREIQERNNNMKASFLDEIVESAKKEPF